MKAETLKKSILQLAVEGKLVPQVDTEEPASVLLEKIREEKEHLIKEKKIKRDKNESIIYREEGHFYEKVGKKEPVCIDDEIPFDIPDSWEWARIQNISHSIQYGYNAPAKDNGKMKMLRISDIQNNIVHWEDVPFCEIAEREIEKYLLKENDILFARTGGTVGKSYIVKNLNVDSVYAGYLIRIQFNINNLNVNYLKKFMESEFYWIQLRRGTIATAQPNCNGKRLGAMLIPIPPLEEQHRIVEKIEEVLPYIEEYGLAEQEIAKLNNDFPEKVKQSVLQYAVEGKLVPQIESEGTAEELLEKIRKEKEQLIKDKKIKRDKNESVIYRENGHFYEKVGKKEPVCIDDEIPFDIPESWEWCRLGSIGKWGAGSTPLRSNKNYYGGDIPWLKTGDLTDTFIEEIPEKITELALKETSVKLNPAGSILIAMYGATIGKLGILKYPATTNQACCACVPYRGLDNIYLFYYLMAIKSYLIHKSEGGAQPNISRTKIVETLICVPPLGEQHRIVEKIEEILPLIKEL